MIRLKSFKSKLVISFVALLVIPFAFIYLNLDRKLEDNALEDIKSSLVKQAALIENQLGVDQQHSPRTGMPLTLLSNRSAPRFPRVFRLSLLTVSCWLIPISLKRKCSGMENHGQRPEVKAAHE